jgi:NAD(P)-dependent dehydrogenase (short-subunit alcohol dehydrogenase family)
MTTPFDFAHKIAIIAGGTGGLGTALRSDLEARGCVVVTISRAHVDDASHITADLRSPEAAAEAIAEVVTRHGAVDIVINAMGVVAFGPINTTSVDTIEELFLTNTFGPTCIDLTTDVSVRINNNITAHAVSSFAIPSNQQFIVRGSEGQISTAEGESFTTWNEASSLLVNNVLEEFPVTNAFVEMVENVSRVIDGGDGWVVPGADSILVAQILDTIAKHS